jgi:hypothetical protein
MLAYEMYRNNGWYEYEITIGNASRDYEENCYRH